MADEPKVYCMHSSLANVADMRPHPKNPNTHPNEQIDMLVASIKHLGWRHPIVVSGRSGYIVAGHARLVAAMRMGFTGTNKC